MRILSGILIFYFAAVMLAPVPCTIASITEEKINCEYTCEENSCDENSCNENMEICDQSTGCNESQDSSKNDCSNSLCCNIQCCNCYFMNEEKHNFSSFPISSTKHYFPENDKITSSFCGDCWQPPELV